MSYLYHVHFSQYLANGRTADGDTTLTLDQPIQYVSDLDQVKELLLARSTGHDVVLKSWRLLVGDRRPVAIPSADGMNGPRVEGRLIAFDDLVDGDEPVSLAMKREPWAPPVRDSRLVPGRLFAPKECAKSNAFNEVYKPAFPLPHRLHACINSNPGPDCECFVCQLSRPAFRHGAQLGSDPDNSLDALRYSRELQARGEHMNATLLDRLHQARQARDLPKARELADHMIQSLVEYVGLGLTSGAAFEYLAKLASALRVVRMSEGAR